MGNCEFIENIEKDLLYLKEQIDNFIEQIINPSVQLEEKVEEKVEEKTKEEQPQLVIHTSDEKIEERLDILIHVFSPTSNINTSIIVTEPEFVPPKIDNDFEFIEHE